MRFGVTAASLLVALAGLTRLAAAAPAVANPQQFAGLKRLEHAILMSGAEAEGLDPRPDRSSWAHAGRVRARRRALGVPGVRAPHPTRVSHVAPRRAGTHAELPRDRTEAGAPQRTPRTSRPSAVAGARDAPANHTVNDRSTDIAQFSMQSEVTIATFGRYALAAWNDGESQSGGDAIGYGWSADGGVTWTDAGAPPHGREIGLWTSDPVVTVDERTGSFTLAGMVVTSRTRNGIGVLTGTIGDAGPVWDAPVLAREVRDTLPDKPWIAADSLTGARYLVYTAFYRKGNRTLDQIEFQRSLDGGLSWSRPVLLSGEDEHGLVQGARPAVGPEGELHVAWKTIDTTEASGGLDYLRVRTSRDRGASFGPRVDAAGFFTNFGSGAPGFNRGFGIAFPGIAVDRSRGPWRGRVYLAWNEGIDVFDDVLGGPGSRTEVEPNESPAFATIFAVGDTLHGFLSSSSESDYYLFAGDAGRTAVLYLDSLATDLDVAFRVLCGDGNTLLAYSAPVGDRPRLITFTLPYSGQYFLRVAPNGPTSGAYRVLTSFDTPGTERARDQRDVFVASSDDGVRWSVPVRVNDDPPLFDDWLPEIAVDPVGRAYVAWYDWRDGDPDVCGGASRVYLARSDDGGAGWTTVGPLADTETDWSDVVSNIAPNQGDYIGLFAAAGGIYGIWADGRFGDPDVVLAVHDPATDPPGRRVTRLTLEAPHPNPSDGALRVRFTLPLDAPADFDVIDAGGRRVRHVEGAWGAGRHDVDLTGGARVPSGLYFIRLRQGAETVVSRVVVIR